ncbi:hypothetical protein OG613_47790 (plasmid) [Streptomyces sp. NBC_00015]|uniref:hypothetical protein n=1 Tax=Streptomyces sp. NBC_00015 TaxID=2903611 RepID=UPI002F9118AA
MSTSARTSTATSKPVVFERWRDVPPRTHATRTQLARADQPRVPGPAPAAYVNGFDFRGKPTTTELFALADTAPTASSARQLAAAAARRTETRTCPDCGARCQQPLPEFANRPLCPMCRRIAQVRALQDRLATKRAELAQWASQLLDDERVAVVWAQVHRQPRTPAGNPRPPLAAHMTAVDHQGRALLDDVIRLAGPRAAGMPGGALPPQEGARRLNDVLGGRRLVCWTDVALDPAARRLAALGHPVRLNIVSSRPGPGWDGQEDTTVRGRIALWRGELDPATGELLPVWEPGRADRLHLLLDRMTRASADTSAEAHAGVHEEPDMPAVAEG